MTAHALEAAKPATAERSTAVKGVKRAGPRWLFDISRAVAAKRWNWRRAGRKSAGAFGKAHARYWTHNTLREKNSPGRDSGSERLATQPAVVKVKAQAMEKLDRVVRPGARKARGTALPPSPRRAPLPRVGVGPQDVCLCGPRTSLGRGPGGSWSLRKKLPGEILIANPRFARPTLSGPNAKKLTLLSPQRMVLLPGALCARETCLPGFHREWAADPRPRVVLPIPDRG